MNSTDSIIYLKTTTHPSNHLE